MRWLVPVVLAAFAAPASAEPTWSAQLGETVGLEGGPAGMIGMASTELQLGYRVHGPWWLYGAASAGSTETECGDCGMSDGRLLGARSGGIYLVCREHDMVCVGLSASVGYEHRRISQFAAFEAGPPPPPYVTDDVLFAEGRAQLRIGLAADFPLAIELGLALRYLRVFGDYDTENSGGMLASLGLVGRL